MKVRAKDLIERFESLQKLDEVKGKRDMSLWLELYKNRLLDLEHKKYLERSGYVFAMAAFESKIKLIFIRLIDEFGMDFTELGKNIEISLSDLKKTEDINLTRGFLISENLNFQNINHVVRNFQTLLKCKSIKDEMKRYYYSNYMRNVQHGKEVISDIFKYAFNVAEKRNLIIHRNNLEINHDNAFVEILGLIDFSVLISEVAADFVDHKEKIPGILIHLYPDSRLKEG